MRIKDVILLHWCCTGASNKSDTMAAAAHDPVRLRRRATKDGGASLYLDIYVHGLRRYEYLHLYLLPDTRSNKARNAEVLALAEAVRARRLLEVRAGLYDTGGRSTLLYDYFRRCMERRRKAGGARWKHWRNVLNVLRLYEPREGLKLADCDRQWCNGWVDFLRSYKGRSGLPLAPNTANTYHKVMRALFNDAVRDGILAASPMATIPAPPAEETARAYLTADELQRLAAAPCDHADVRRAFLFSCLTGLRRSDVDALTWGDVKHVDGCTRVELRQRKTRALAYIDLAAEAADLLGERGEDDGRVFRLPAPNNTATYLREWVARAGVAKHITYHSARHTFATLLLTRGADLYTVSKLLGHRSIATTQVYGKIVDERRRAAVGLLEGIIEPTTGCE